MEFTIETATMDDLIIEIKKMETVKEPWNEKKQEMLNDKTMQQWKQLDHNICNKGNPIFGLKIKQRDNPFMQVVKKLKKSKDPSDRVPTGNYYIEFYTYENKTNIQSVTGCTDLCWNSKSGKMTRKGIMPLFLFLDDFEKRNVKGKKKDLLLVEINALLNSFILDRLEQICSKKKAMPDASLMSRSIDAAFNNIVKSKGNKKNFKEKVLNGVHVISKAPTIKSKSGETWEKYSFDWMNRKTRGQTLSDCLEGSKNTKVSEVRELIKYFEEIDDTGIILGPSSEESGQKGGYAFLNEELQRLRYPKKKNYFTTFKGLCFGLKEKSNKLIYTIYVIGENISKLYSRCKSLLGSDTSIPYDIHANKLDEEGKKIFGRHATYLSESPEEIGKLRLDTIQNNMLVVYAPGNGAKAEISYEDFKNCDKNKYNKLLDMTDCHLAISEEAASTKMRVRRTISESITECHLTEEFKAFTERMKESNDEKDREWNISEPIGHYHVCSSEGCNSVMTPVSAFPLGEENEEIKVISANENTELWYCECCGDNEANVVPTKINIGKKFEGAEKIIIYEAIFDPNDLGIEIFADIILPINQCRVVSEDGIKAYTNIVGRHFSGDISGRIWDPINEKYISLNNIPVDAIANNGNMKGKFSGVAISHVAAMNALTGSKICLDQMYKDNNSNESKINEMLSNCEKVDWTHLKYDEKKDAYIMVTEKVWVGIVSLSITEMGVDFSKTKTEKDPMKISHMNSKSYKDLELNDLDRAMAKSSFENIENEDNLDFTTELIKIFKSDTEGLIELTHDEKNKPMSDFNNPEKGRINILSWSEKADWVDALDSHPMLQKDSKFVNGSYYRYKDVKGKERTVVFPSRKMIMRLIKPMNGDRIRINTLIKNALGIYLDIFTHGYSDKIDQYKKNALKELSGKYGTLARMSTYINCGYLSKIVGSSDLPTGVVVVGSKSYWKMVKRNCKKLGMNYKDILSGKSTLYGSRQRDPFIWALQCLGAVEVWSPERADIYFRGTENKDGTYSGGEHWIEELDEDGNICRKPLSFYEKYPNFKGMMLCTLDMLYIYQEDSDGDLGRLLTPFEINTQLELKKVNEFMKDYGFLFRSDPKAAISEVIRRSGKWHFDYVIDEALSTSEVYPDQLKIKLSLISIFDANEGILNAIEAKGQLGTITVSEWKIHLMTDLYVAMGALTRDQALAINTYYSTIVNQEGCVKGMKNNINLGSFSLDNIAGNLETEWIDRDGNEMKANAREMLAGDMKKNGYGDVSESLINIAIMWQKESAIEVKNGEARPNKKLMSKTAEMINAYMSLGNGSEYLGKDPLNYLERLIYEDSKYLDEKDIIKPLMPLLERIALKDAKERKSK